MLKVEIYQEKPPYSVENVKIHSVLARCISVDEG